MHEMENRFKTARMVHNRHGNQSVKTVSQITGVTTSLINDLESNVGKKRGVSYLVIAELAKHYGVSTDYLIGLTNEPTNDSDEKMVCDLTGLSTASVRALRSFQETIRGGFRPPCFDEMVQADIKKETDCTLSVIKELDEEIKECEEVLQTPNEEFIIIDNAWESVDEYKSYTKERIESARRQIKMYEAQLTPESLAREKDGSIEYIERQCKGAADMTIDVINALLSSNNSIELFSVLAQIVFMDDITENESWFSLKTQNAEYETCSIMNTTVILQALFSRFQALIMDERKAHKAKYLFSRGQP